MAMYAQQIQDQDRVEVRTRFGTLPVNKQNLLSFPEGLPGFEELHQFTLLHDENNTSVYYLQSTEDPDIRFPVTSPHWFRVDYEISLSDEEWAMLELESPEDAVVLVTITNDTEGSSNIQANFRTPIILNTTRNIGLQKPMYAAESSILIHSH